MQAFLRSSMKDYKTFNKTVHTLLLCCILILNNFSIVQIGLHLSSAINKELYLVSNYINFVGWTSSVIVYSMYKWIPRHYVLSIDSRSGSTKGVAKLIFHRIEASKLAVLVRLCEGTWECSPPASERRQWNTTERVRRFRNLVYVLARYGRASTTIGVLSRAFLAVWRSRGD